MALKRPERVLPRLLSVGTAVPDSCWTQLEAQDEMARLWGLQGAALLRWQRIIAGTGIETRRAVIPVRDVIHLTTSQRMVAYEKHAPALASEAARTALNRVGMDPTDVTDLIVVSCTGFSAPGVDAALVDLLGLQPTVRRTLIGFMGCFGAISGLRTAVGACCANTNAVALVVCVELCSLHLRTDRDVQNQVASALFADGAAAAVVVSDAGSSDAGDQSTESIGRITTGASLLLSQGADWMTWQITDAGFAMTLSREVPTALRAHLKKFVANASPERPGCFVIHPGGPGILDAADEALNLRGGCGLEASREILRQFGNMSSSTVLFVLEEALRQGNGAHLPAMLLAFGPGLTIESLTLLPME